MSLADWGKFVAAHLRGARGERSTARTGSRSWAPIRGRSSHAPGDGYAMGWSVGVRPGWAKGAGADDTGRVLSHNGSNTMWFCGVDRTGEGVRGARRDKRGGMAAKGTDEASAVIREWQK